MNSLLREQDFYRQQCDVLGAQLLELQERLQRSQQEARQYRIAATLIREGYYLLGHPGITLAEIRERFLYIVLDSIQVDCAAFLTYHPDQQMFTIDHDLGFSNPVQSRFTLPGFPGAFLVANAETVPDEILLRLHQVLGVPYLVWSFNQQANLVLIVGNRTEDQHLHRPFGDHNRNLINVALSVYVEITQRQQLEEALAQERDLLHGLMDNVPDWIYFKDSQSRFIRNNKTHLQLLGVSDQSSAIGKTDFDFFPLEFAQQCFDEEQAIIQTGQPLIAKERRTPAQDGSILWVSETKIPLRDETGQIIGLVGISRDITTNKQAEEQQMQLTVEKQRVQILAEFIRAASHEFRTPLSILNTSLYLLGRLDDPIKRSDRLQVANSQVAYITDILEEMLRLSHLDSKDALSIRPVNVNSILRVIETTARSAAVEKQQILIFQLADDLPNIPADEYELHYAVNCLVDNALFYTPAGGTITIQTYIREAHVVVDIRDTGIGISDKDLPQIFDRFFRVDQARSTRGAGLGLSTAKKIVELHRGYIDVESTLHEGSTFRVWLPTINHVEPR